jgi:hypothetical protein
MPKKRSLVRASRNPANSNQAVSSGCAGINKELAVDTRERIGGKET